MTEPAVTRGYTEDRAPNEVFVRRSRRFLWIGLVLGAIAGALIGLLLGTVAFESARGIWASILGGSIFFALVGAFTGGMSSLEPPQPGRELSRAEADPTGRTPRKGSPPVVEEHIANRDGPGRPRG